MCFFLQTVNEEKRHLGVGDGGGRGASDAGGWDGVHEYWCHGSGDR